MIVVQEPAYGTGTHYGGIACGPVFRDVVREALDSLGRTSMRVAGFNKIAVFLLQRLLPRRLATSLLTKASYDSSRHPRPAA